MNVREAAIELRWFFTEAEGELGLRGVSLEPGTGSDASDQVADRRARSCARWTEVSHRLRAIGHLERVLRLAYTPHRWPGLERWYELAGVAAWLLNPEDVTQAARHLAGAKHVEADPIRKHAKDTLRNALAAFVEAR